MIKSLLKFVFLIFWSIPLYAQSSNLVVSAVSTANASVTATIPAAGTGTFHYINAIDIQRTCTTAIAGTAVLTVTSTNFPGSFALTLGNACLVGSTTINSFNYSRSPLKSSVSNTNSTIVCPALGATGICRINVYYFVTTSAL